jgi:hypothetical protein
LITNMTPMMLSRSSPMIWNWWPKIMRETLMMLLMNFLTWLMNNNQEVRQCRD